MNQSYNSGVRMPGLPTLSIAAFEAQWSAVTSLIGLYLLGGMLAYSWSVYALASGIEHGPFVPFSAPVLLAVPLVFELSAVITLLSRPDVGWSIGIIAAAVRLLMLLIVQVHERLGFWRSLEFNTIFDVITLIIAVLSLLGTLLIYLSIIALLLKSRQPEDALPGVLSRYTPLQLLIAAVIIGSALREIEYLFLLFGWIPTAAQLDQQVRACLYSVPRFLRRVLTLLIAFTVPIRMGIGVMLLFGQRFPRTAVQGLFVVLLVKLLLQRAFFAFDIGIIEHALAALPLEIPTDYLENLMALLGFLCQYIAMMVLLSREERVQHA